jgi:2-deoxy-D-gluconate 3-dehydrogenase
MEFPNYKLEGRKALVTGGSSGIGQHVALSLADAGCQVLVTGRNQKALEETAAQIQKMGQPAHFLVADLADTKAAAAMARQADRILKGVDILVNNAGLSIPESALTATEENWDITLNVNLKAPMFISQQIAPGMIERGGGKIIMISSAAGFFGLPNHAAYGSSKGGMITLTKVLAVEWARYNVNVNGIAPTATETPMVEKTWGTPDRRAIILSKIPAGRFGKPLDISGAVLFLASPASDFMNGETIMVDGGRAAQ